MLWNQEQKYAFLLPAANVGVAPLAAAFAVGAKAHHVHLALDARVQVLIRVAPRVIGQLFQVHAPVARLGRRAGANDTASTCRRSAGRCIAASTDPRFSDSPVPCSANKVTEASTLQAYSEKELLFIKFI